MFHQIIIDVVEKSLMDVKFSKYDTAAELTLHQYSWTYTKIIYYIA